MEQREIKFRIWCAEKSLMIEPFTIEHLLANYNSEDDYSALSGSDLFRLGNVEGNVIMQFTNHLDKNGKEIYDRDIVCDGNNQYYEVYWDRQFQFSIRSHNKYGHKQFHGSLTDNEFIIPESMKFEVVGNIFENPDLLNN